MAEFGPALRKTLAHEGGYVDDPDDPGGRTDYGISEAAHPEAWQDGRVTYEEARSIYRVQYWNRVKGRQIDDQRAAEKLFDLAVNVGPVGGVSDEGDLSAGEAAQRALRNLGHPVALDGVIGPETISAINAANPDDLINELCWIQADHYRRWIGRREGREKFFRGLMRRAFYRARDPWNHKETR